MPRLVSVDQIKIQNRIRKEYGDIEELAKSIREVGLLHPIIITKDYVLITGERRLMAVKSLGQKEIKAEITTATNREKCLLMEIAENEKRKNFTPSERLAYGRELERIEELKAKERQGKRTDLTSCSDEQEVRNEAGGTRDVVSKKVGMSGTSYFRAKKVVGAILLAVLWDRIAPEVWATSPYWQEVFTDG